MKKIVSKKGKTFAQVAKPIQNLIEKLKDRPKSQANDNTIMLLEKQLDDLFAKQEAIKEAENPQPEMPMEQPMQGMQQMQQPMGQPMAEQMPMAPEGQPMEQPAMGYGGYIPKFYDGGIPYVGQVGTAYRDEDPMMGRQVYGSPIGPPQTMNYIDKIQLPDNMVYNSDDIANPYPNAPLSINTIKNNNNTSRRTIPSPYIKAAGYKNPYDYNYMMMDEAKIKQNQDAKKALDAKNAASTNTNTKNKFDRWGEVGAIGTSIGALAQEMRNINSLKRPGMLQNIYLSPGAAPDKVDYTAEQERLNTDVAAAREANRLAGGNPAVLGQLRAEQLRRRGEIMQGQENANTALMNEFKQRQAEAFQKSQAANADIAKENMYNEYGYDQNQIAQRNAAIAAGANTIGGVFNNMTAYQNQIDAAKIMANANPKSVWTDSAGQKYLTLTSGENVPIKAFGGMTYADGGSVYKQRLAEVIKNKSNADALKMDAEYEQALKNKQSTYKSNITGLEYKVLPRAEKDLYAANLWKDAHKTAPTKSQKEATKKVLEGKPTSSIKAVAAVEHARQNVSTSTEWSTEKPSWLTPQMEQAQASINQDRAEASKRAEEEKTIKTLKFWNPAGARYYEQTGDLQGALDNFVAPDRFDESSGAAGFSMGRALKEGNATGLDYTNMAMMAAKLGSLKRTPKMLGPEEPQFMESITRNAELAKARNARGKGSFTYRQKRANEERLANWEENGRKAKLDLENERAGKRIGAISNQEDEDFVLNRNAAEERANSKIISYEPPVKEQFPNMFDLRRQNQEKTQKQIKSINRRMDKQEIPKFDELVKQETKSLTQKIKVIETQLTKARKAGDKAKVSYWTNKLAEVSNQEYAFGGKKR